MEILSDLRNVVKGNERFGVSRPSVQFSSVAQSCPTLCDPMNRSTPGLPAHHQYSQGKSLRYYLLILENVSLLQKFQAPTS